MKLASCTDIFLIYPHKNIYYGFSNPSVVYSTDRSKAVDSVLVLLFVALWFILRGDLFVLFCSCVFHSFKHCDYLAWGNVSLSLCFS